MKRSIPLLLLNLFIFISLSAQQKNYTITGLLFDSDLKEPLTQGTVRLLKASDSTMVTGTVSDLNGKFQLSNVKRGNYIVHVSFVGLNDVYKPVSLATSKSLTVNLGQIDLTASSIMLGEAVIVGKAVEVAVRNDTIEYNAASYKTQEGAVMEDLLKKMPGVEIDENGKITVNGKEIKKIMIDGKEFFSDDPTVATKNLPVEMIEKIQVLDKKSDMAKMTGFNDDEEETVINLTVKPEKKKGWFGNVLAGYGSDNRYEGNFMVNHFVGNNQFSVLGGINNTNNMGFNDMAASLSQGMGSGRRRGNRGPGNGITKSRNLGFNFSTEFKPDTLILGGDVGYSGANTYLNTRTNTQNFLTGGTTTTDNKINSSNNNSNNFWANFRLEWKPDTMTQLIFRPRVSYNVNKYRDSEDGGTFNDSQDTINYVNSWSNSKYNGVTFSANLDFSRRLNDKGRVFSVGLRGGFNDAKSNGSDYSRTRYYNTDDLYFSPDSVIDQLYNYNDKGYNYRAFVSWVEPLGRNNFLQFTYRFSHNYSEAIKNTYDQQRQDEHGNLMLDSLYSRSSRSNFFRQRAGIAFKSEREKYNYTIGVNVDPSVNKSETFIGNYVIDSLAFTQRVVNFSPTAQLRYNFDKRINLRFDYNGYVTQPTMAQLQPVQNISNPTNVVVGNPNLKPSFKHNMRGHFQFFKPETQFSFMTFLDGSYVVNDIVSVSDYIAAEGKRVSSYANMNGNWSGSLAAIINSPLKNKKFSVSSFTRMSYNHQNGRVNSEDNTSNSLVLMEAARFNYRSDLFDVGINGMVRMNNSRNSLKSQEDMMIFNYNAGASTTIYLPWNMSFDSDVNYDTNSGYSNGYKINTWLWNASLSKQFLKNKQATVRVKMFDILDQRSSVWRSVKAESITDTEYNTIGRYFMFYFVYRFNTFGDKMPKNKMMEEEDGPPHRR
ncbi:MAG: outer membrane beta-barrel protein [Bacteroidales bacterium]|nr:outer membrane beta-barrel protein [Bacteroidales bacterium]